ncbi:MAG TPA: hypothetical protein VLW26_03265 [Steroidobacteraceae bacterium]|nr:hypothetical protein [Steroidobacteraceae bacterium]
MSKGRAAVLLRQMSIVLVSALAACSTFQKLSPKHRESEQRAADVHALGLEVMRFADAYAGRTREAVQRFTGDSPTTQVRLRGREWAVEQSESAYTIATGPNPVTNAIDMVVLATLSRMVLDDLWAKHLYGERARPLQAASKALESSAWEMLQGRLTDTQLMQLHEIISRWRAANPDVRSVAYIHLSDLAKSFNYTAGEDQRSSGGLLSLVGLDPLNGLDPAVREIAQTRDLAERSIFYVQRMPAIIDLRVQLISDQLAVMPETQQVLGDVSRASLVGSAADRLSQTLPQVLDKEREALVRQLMGELNDHGESIGHLSENLRATLQAGTDTATALHGALEAVDHITQRLASQSAAAPKAPAGRPFDIREYTEAVRALSGTMQQLDTLAQHLDQALPAMQTVTRDAAAHVADLEDHLFRQLLLLLAVAIVGTFLAAVGYRALTRRLS